MKKSNEKLPFESISELRKRRGILIDLIQSELNSVKKYNKAINNSKSGLDDIGLSRHLSEDARASILNIISQESTKSEDDYLKSIIIEVESLFSDIKSLSTDDPILKSYENQFTDYIK